jgi:hypothetical protein
MNSEPTDYFEHTDYFEPVDFAETLARRKLSASQTLRAVSEEELRALIAQLLPDKEDPFTKTFTDFIEEHRSEPAVCGRTFDGIDFVYYPQSNRGMWYKKEAGAVVGIGLIGEAALKALSEIALPAGHS